MAEAEKALRAEQWQLVEHIVAPLVSDGDEVALALTLSARLHEEPHYLAALRGLDDLAALGSGQAAHELAMLHDLLHDPECAERYRRMAEDLGWVAPVPVVLSPEDARLIARVWFEQPQPLWAHLEVARLIRHEPDNALLVLHALVDAAPDEDALGSLGADLLEDLVRAHGMGLVAQLERRAADARWREVLGTVWLEDRDDEITRRLEALGCTQLRNR